MKSKESLLLKDTQSCEGKCLLQLRGQTDLYILNVLLSWCCGSREREALNSAPEEKGEVSKEGNINCH